MDVCKAVSAYVARMVKEVQGMKILLLDDHTTPIMSAAYTQSALLEHEVFLTDKIQNGVRERMQHLQCVVFVSPCHVSFHALVEELRQPLYGSYWLYFSNAVPKHAIEQLAEADQHQVVQSVQEYFADYVPVTPSLFSLNYPAPPMPIWGTSASQWDAEAFQRHSSGLMAVLLSLKKKPVVRYERMSALALKLAKDMVYKMNEAHAPLFDFRRTDIPPLLLILDRRNDPVTPLLSQWTYQAMVHELIGIHNGRTQVPGKQGELEETVLSVDRDPFFAANLYDNFGDLGASIKEYVTKFQTRSSSTSSIDTIQDMKRFVEEYPEFQRLRGNVSKHVALLGELSKIVELRHLLKVSELEQSLASTESHTTDLRALQEMLASEQIVNEAKLRLAILYALRYQKWSGNQIDAVARQLMQVGLEESQVVLLYVMLNFAGAEQRQDDLFANENIFSRGKSALKGLKGVENVYTQHSPHILETVENLMRGRLRTSSYPFAATEPSGPDAAMPSTLAPNGPLTKPQDVILFIIGGTTYEEARAIALLNGAQPGAPSQQPFPGTHFLLGGSTIHNSHSFLHMIETTAARMPNSITRPPPSAGGNGMHLRLGPVQLGMEDREALHDGINGAREFASDLFGRFKRGVENNL
ncbi:vacuolar protein sorting-associated protein 45 [Malassezia vespertilionis]|uniref:Vps45p n=1 Tax=Malassezia vespertilionis TaxID=2020962 RepID=A0A2N1J9L2_9BASI|nr:vacuolar protein sorting-associated protein 45 [Malassezia vespertilionis]PKI83236.1 Vps45p [Malassezia vespertilionis]WFD07858.1 vacuolar protein sorting-associated protein 45 [Malassezia vespertilionis]